MKLFIIFIISSIFASSSTIAIEPNHFEHVNIDYLTKIGIYAIQIRQTYTVLYQKMFHSNFTCDEAHNMLFKTKEDLIKGINKELIAIKKIKKMIFHNEENTIQNGKVIDDISIPYLNRMIQEYNSYRKVKENYRFIQAEKKEQSLFDYLFGNTINN